MLCKYFANTVFEEFLNDYNSWQQTFCQSVKCKLTRQCMDLFPWTMEAPVLVRNDELTKVQTTGADYFVENCFGRFKKLTNWTKRWLFEGAGRFWEVFLVPMSGSSESKEASWPLDAT